MRGQRWGFPGVRSIKMCHKIRVTSGPGSCHSARWALQSKSQIFSFESKSKNCVKCKLFSCKISKSDMGGASVAGPAECVAGD